MTNAVDMRLWYVPIEIITLRRWLVAAFVVNIMLLTVDVLRADSKLLILGVLSCLLFAALRASLPEINDTFRRNVCLVLSSSLLGLSAYRLLIAEPTVFNFWIHCWSLVPSGLALYWLSGRPVTVWTARKLSDSAFEYGLLRNAKLGGRLEAIGAHITLVHFVAISVIPLIWVIDIAFSEGNSLGGQIGDSFTTEHFEKTASDIIHTDYGSVSWKRGLSGARTARLDDSQGSLMRLEPGDRVFSHGHSTLEAMIVLEGALDDGRAVFEAGDLVLATPGIRHRPSAAGNTACTCFVARADTPFWRFT